MVLTATATLPISIGRDPQSSLRYRRERAAVMAQAEQMAKRLVWVHRGTIFKVATALLQQCSSAGQPQARLDGDALSDALGGPAVVAILRAAARPRDA